MSIANNTREFREAVLTALGVSDDKDVENSLNFRKAVLTALGVSYTDEDVKNEQKFRALLVSAADDLGDNLKAANIKKDVTILGVTGTYTG